MELPQLGSLALSMEACFGELIKLSSQCKCYRSQGCFTLSLQIKISSTSYCCFIFSTFLFVFLSSRRKPDQFRKKRWGFHSAREISQKHILESDLAQQPHFILCPFILNKMFMWEKNLSSLGPWWKCFSYSVTDQTLSLQWVAVTECCLHTTSSLAWNG